MHILLQIIIGFYIAELFGGIFHWFEDSYFDYCTGIPIVSDIIKANEIHHFFPRSILSYSYFENIEITLYITIVMYVIFFIFYKQTMVTYIYLFGTAFFFSVCINIIHRFSHMRDCELPTIIKKLQKNGVIMSHEEHRLHHQDGDDKYFIMNSYTNKFLDKLKFFETIEGVIYKITGVSPNKKAYNSYKDIQNYMHVNAKLECPDKPTKKDVEILGKLLEDFKACHLSSNQPHNGRI